MAFHLADSESKVISAPSQLIRPAFTPSTAAPQRPPSQVPKPSGKVVQSALGELFMDMWDEEKLNSAASEPVFKSVDSDATIQIIDTSVGKKLSCTCAHDVVIRPMISYCHIQIILLSLINRAALALAKSSTLI
jgi:hypothetical protein